MAATFSLAAPAVASDADIDPDAKSNVPVRKATWNGEGDGKSWDDGANWSPKGVPGSSGSEETQASISAMRGEAAEVILKSDTTHGSLNMITISAGSSLTIESGAVLGNLTFLVDYLSSGDSVVTMNGGSWTQDESGGLISIGRMQSDAFSDTTSKFVMNGGIYQSSNAFSTGRVDVGHGGNLGTAIFEMNGGEFITRGPMNLNGSHTGISELKFTGGNFSVNGLNLNVSTAEGMNCFVEVTGSQATIEAGVVNLHKHEDNTTGTATARFIFDNKGVSKIAATTLNLGQGSSAGSLEVDVSQIAGNGSTGYTLFEFDQLEGSFGDVKVRSGDTLLKEGKEGSLRMNEYALSSGKSGVFIKLFFKSQRPPVGAKPFPKR